MSIVVLLIAMIFFGIALYCATDTSPVARTEHGLIFIGQMLRAIFYLLIAISWAVVYSQM